MPDSDRRAIWNTAKTLHKKKNRTETGLFLIEGRREIELAGKHGIEIIATFDKTDTSSKDLERITYCGEIAAVAKIPERKLQNLTIPETASGQPPANPLIVILDNLEKPGNAGAIIRTAEAAGVTAVIMCGAAADFTNPNLIRSSLGAVFSLPVYSASQEAAAAFLDRHNIPVIIASPDASKNYFEHDFAGAVAITLGSEADGVSGFWTKKASDSVRIPMTGEVNSLNVSASAAILIYHAVSNRMRK